MCYKRDSCLGKPAEPSVLEGTLICPLTGHWSLGPCITEVCHSDWLWVPEGGFVQAGYSTTGMFTCQAPESA